MDCTKPVERLLTKLPDAKPAGKGWTARCPAHEDRTASLSIAEGDDGRALLHCHAGCKVNDVCDALGLRVVDLMPTADMLPMPKSNGKLRIVATYDYRAEQGDLLFQAIRYQPKDFRQRRPKPGGGWDWTVKGVRVVPYRLPELLAEPTRPVVVVEGEKDADNLAGIGVIATTNAGGAGKWTAEHAEFLRGRRVIVLPDNDESGRKHAQQVAQSLEGIAESVRIVELPGLPHKGDVSDWIASGGTKDQLRELAAATPVWTAAAAATTPCAAEPEGDAPKLSQATVLVELVRTVGTVLFHSPAGEAFATLPVGEHRETHRVRSKAFRQWLARLFYAQSKKAPGAQGIADAQTVLEGAACFDGEEHQVHVRIAEHANKIYIDLCDAAWRAVEIDDAGWRVVTDPPVRFRRAKAMLPLPMPASGGRLDELRQFINVDDDGWTLAAAWLVAATRPLGPYPALALTAEQGSGKSTQARLLRSLIDPNTAPLRSEPREPRDLMIAASNGWCVAIDNVSHVPTWLSDCLCRLATGGGFSTRTLYENDEETIFDAQRPAILTGIEEYVTRGDLLDRSLVVHLPTIPERRRRPEAELLAAWDAAHPRLFGALLSAVSTAMRLLPATKLDRLPRMADFALWSAAAEPAFCLPAGTSFIGTYAANRESAVVGILEDSLVAKSLPNVLNAGSWTGTATELHQALELIVSEKDQKSKTWPKSGRQLSGHLRRLAPALRQAGVDVEFVRTMSGRHIAIRTSRENTVMTVMHRHDPQKHGKTHDDDDDEKPFHDDGMTMKNPVNDANDDDDDEIHACSSRVRVTI